MVNDGFQNLTVDKKNQYVDKGFPIGYDNKEFGSSSLFEKLKKNIAEFFSTVLPKS